MSIIDLNSRFAYEDLAAQVTESLDWDIKAVIKFVTMLDAEMADNAFTLRLIETLSDSYSDQTNVNVTIFLEDSK